ncbi:hypothetical protein PV327_003142 [Microctonus hyperodae]|uniref:EGF-like domain-containing protein n=1 Tax=Microctonus hyperodae TaxID=165561 RepID=A0AA39G3E1_MICHY|nr:hypothetical protein PV327_003142 [Microctonus hyperodae]
MDACEMDQTQSGCRIFNAECSCGYGCKSEYRYLSMNDCKLALKGRRSNKCNEPNPCKHHGICLQISQSPGFKCRCEGTRYYGPSCERPCPEPNNFSTHIPWEFQKEMCIKNMFPNMTKVCYLLLIIFVIVINNCMAHYYIMDTPPVGCPKDTYFDSKTQSCLKCPPIDPINPHDRFQGCEIPF